MEDVVRCVALHFREDAEGASLWSRTCRAAHSVPITTTTTYRVDGKDIAHRGVPISFVRWESLPRGVVRWLRWSDRTSPAAAYVAGRKGLGEIEAPTWYMFGAVHAGLAEPALRRLFGTFDAATATETVMQVMGADLDRFALGGSPPSPLLRLLRRSYLTAMFEAYRQARVDIPTLRRYALVCLDAG